MITFLLKNDVEIGTLDAPINMTLGGLIAKARDFLKDDRIRDENFGTCKRFYFVNRSTRTLIDDNVPTHLPLGELAVRPEHELEMVLQ